MFSSLTDGRRRVVVVLVWTLLAGLGCGAGAGGGKTGASGEPSADAAFESSHLCRGCHVRIAEQHAESVHAKAFSNPVFQAQFAEFLPRRHADPEGYGDEPPCLACHAPIYFFEGWSVAPDGSRAKDMTSVDQDCAECHKGEMVDSKGVTCDFCHRIEGYTGDAPGNANYVATPGTLKLGPFKYPKDHHRQYSPLQTSSEFCALCHESTNRHGVAIRTTFQEWKDSPFARQGIHCQDCHMTVDGFLTGGTATYESGKAAFMSVGSAPERDKLYTHRFVGAHSATQIEGAVTLAVRTQYSTPQPGQEGAIVLEVDNSRGGHKLPSGSAELRAAWLEVKAWAGDAEVRVRLPEFGTSYGLAGVTSDDRSILGDHIPDGQRIYRSVFLDESGRQTIRSYEAQRKIFDNRLEAAEKRRETFLVDIPAGATGELVVEASLYYLRYPQAFAVEMNLPVAEPVLMAHTWAVLPLGAAH